MNKNRTIKSIVYAKEFDMGGMPVRQAFPSSKAERVDPFLLLHHADVKVSADIPTNKAGVGPHPHRGFSPVTFIFKGGVHHRDSRGNNNVIYEGGTQWMNAGMGIIHSEDLLMIFLRRVAYRKLFSYGLILPHLIKKTNRLTFL
jgi:quercetin 2,3-dioxygenase